jgi:hypothetical protein
MMPDTATRRLRDLQPRTAGYRRWRGPALWALALVAGFVVYLQLARTRAVNSDGASQALQAWDILHGNLLMHGWTTTDVALYTTEIPEYLLVELAHGLGQGVVHVAAAITYTLVVVLAAGLAKGTATGREAVIRVLIAVGIMLAPQLDSGTNVLVSSPDHIGTSVPILLAWLILDRAGRPDQASPPEGAARWWVPLVVTVILAWTAVADEVVLVAAILPLIGVCAFRAARARAGRGYQITLAAGGVVAALVSVAAPHVMRGLGGYDEPPLASSLSSAHMIVTHNLPLTGEGFLLLGGAYFPGLQGAQFWFTLLHLVGVALAACGVAVTLWRFFRGERLVPQLLVTGLVINVAAYALGTHAVVLPNTREMAPVLPFAAVLAGRQLAGPLLAARRPVRLAALPVLGAVLAGYVAGLALELTAPAVPAQNAQLASWLADHHFKTGLSGYWQANVVTLTSGGRVQVRALDDEGSRLVRHVANSNAKWFNPAVSSADFVVLGPTVDGYPGFTDRSTVIATFGQPARVYHDGPYTILQWHKNLLTDLGS